MELHPRNGSLHPSFLRARAEMEGMSSALFPTICPGCGLGCGLYLAQDLSILEFRRACPVNAGKLCGFGVKLNRYYSENPAPTPMISGEESHLESAIREAARILKHTKPNLICMGNATCEELLGFAKLGQALGVNPSLGFLGFGEIQIPRFQISLDKIQDQPRILSVVDPKIQYPLLARRLMRALSNNAQILEISFQDSGICTQWIPLSDGIQQIRNLDFQPSVAIFELNPLWDADWIKFLIHHFSQIPALVLSPFLNLHCGIELGFSLDLAQSNAAYLFEPPRVLPQRLIQYLESMEHLILHTSIQHPLSREADVVIPNAPFFQRNGWVINPEGRILVNHGSHPAGVGIFDAILRELGYAGISLDGMRSELSNLWGIDKPNEYKIQLGSSKPTNKAHQVPIQKPRSDFRLCYRTNPFFWNGIQHRDFLELNPKDMRSAGIFKSEIIELRLGNGSFRIKAKPSQVPPGILISEIPLGNPQALIQPASFSRISHG